MAQQQDKIIKIYKSKEYEYNVGSFLSFLNEKVEVDSYKIDMIKNKIDQFDIEFKFDEKIFRLLLKLTGAVQKSDKKVLQMTKQQVMNSSDKITFKSSKSTKKNGQQASAQTQQKREYRNQKNEEKNEMNNNLNIKIPTQIKKNTQKQQRSVQQMIKPSNIKLQQIEQDDEPSQYPKISDTFLVHQPQYKQNINYYEPVKKDKLVSVQPIEQKKTSSATQKSTNFQRLKTIQQVQNSSEINLTQQQQSLNANQIKLNKQYQSQAKSFQSKNYQQNSFQNNGPKFLNMEDELSNQSKHKNFVKILHYEKFSTDYVNSVIKYTLQYNHYNFKKSKYEKANVLRRFSQFQKLLNLLREKYIGFILPQLPPKEGIKAGMTYFWGVDEAFLQQRKQKLEQMLNRLLECSFLKDQQFLQSFLTDKNYEIQFAKKGYGQYLKNFTDIVFNANQLKDYGVAYCNYLKQKGNVKLNPEVQKKYEAIKKIVKIFADLNEYRKKINTNFDKRREILLDIKIKTISPYSANFDKSMDLIQEQIRNLTFEMEKYQKLKFQESWIHELKRQKQQNNTKAGNNELIQQQAKIQNTIKKMQQNLMISLQQFKKSKVKKLEEINKQILKWRENVHP